MQWFNKGNYIMNKEELKFVKNFINSVIASIIEDNQEREKFVENVFEDVVKDVEECSDKDDLSNEDVRIALARVILKKSLM